MRKQKTATFHFAQDKPVHVGFYKTLIVERVPNGVDDNIVEVRTPTTSYWNGEQFFGAFGLPEDPGALWNWKYPIDEYACKGIYDRIPVEVLTWTGVVK